MTPALNNNSKRVKIDDLEKERRKHKFYHPVTNCRERQTCFGSHHYERHYMHIILLGRDKMKATGETVEPDSG